MHTNRRNQKVALFVTKDATTEWACISICCGAYWFPCTMTFAQVIKCLNTIRDEKHRKELKAYFKSLW